MAYRSLKVHSRLCVSVNLTHHKLLCCIVALGDALDDEKLHDTLSPLAVAFTAASDQVCALATAPASGILFFFSLLLLLLVVVYIFTICLSRHPSCSLASHAMCAHSSRAS